MNNVTRNSRLTAALQVIQYMNNGLSVSKACKEVGIPRSSYYAIIDREKTAIATFQEQVETNHLANLWAIVINQNAILQQVIREGLAETTSPRERLAIYKTLTEMQDKLIDKLRLHSRGATVSSDLFTGPVLQLAKSRFTSRYMENGTDTDSDVA